MLPNHPFSPRHPTSPRPTTRATGHTVASLASAGTSAPAIAFPTVSPTRLFQYQAPARANYTRQRLPALNSAAISPFSNPTLVATQSFSFTEAAGQLALATNATTTSTSLATATALATTTSIATTTVVTTTTLEQSPVAPVQGDTVIAPSEDVDEAIAPTTVATPNTALEQSPVAPVQGDTVIAPSEHVDEAIDADYNDQSSIARMQAVADALLRPPSDFPRPLHLVGSTATASIIIHGGDATPTAASVLDTMTTISADVNAAADSGNANAEGEGDPSMGAPGAAESEAHDDASGGANSQPRTRARSDSASEDTRPSTRRRTGPTAALSKTTPVLEARDGFLAPKLKSPVPDDNFTPAYQRKYAAAPSRGRNILIEGWCPICDENRHPGWLKLSGGIYRDHMLMTHDPRRTRSKARKA